MSSGHIKRATALGVIAAATAATALLGLAGCGYDTNNQNSPNSTHVGTNTADPTP